jgi:hypothetical protein
MGSSARYCDDGVRHICILDRRFSAQPLQDGGEHMGGYWSENSRNSSHDLVPYAQCSVELHMSRNDVEGR